MWPVYSSWLSPGRVTSVVAADEKLKKLVSACKHFQPASFGAEQNPCVHFAFYVKQDDDE